MRARCGGGGVGVPGEQLFEGDELLRPAHWELVAGDSPLTAGDQRVKAVSPRWRRLRALGAVGVVGRALGMENV